MGSNRPKVVIVGAGFAGLYAARALAKQAVDVLIIDRKNHHTFQPLLYQVALAVLSPAEIASPIRAIFKRNKNVTVMLGEVTDFDLANKTVLIKDDDGHKDEPIHYDYLILAAGAGNFYFGHPEWEQYAPGLKSIEDALEIRRRVLNAFERAERHAATQGSHEPLNFVVIGGGPTGVELAGSIADIARIVMAEDFRAIDPSMARILLLEGGPRVLASYPEDLSQAALKQLEELGVEVRTQTMVTDIGAMSVTMKHVGNENAQLEIIPAAVAIWGAGVAPSPLGKKIAALSGAQTDRAGRVVVEKDLTLPGHPEVFVTGDLVAFTNPDGKVVPGVAPAAIQMGGYAGRAIAADLAQRTRTPFHYWDKGSLATIGRSRAVGDLPGIHLTGFFAWLAWLLIHVMFLVGFSNRFMVMMEWAWAYFFYRGGARLITDKH